MAPRKGSRGSNPQRNRTIETQKSPDEASGSTSEPASNDVAEPTQELIGVLEREGIQLSPHAAQAVKQQVRKLTFSAEVRSAPIPSAAELEEYNAVSPGLGDRIVEAWFEQSNHRRDMERLAGERQDKHFTLGQWFAFIIAGASIPAATVVGIMGSPVAAGVIVAVCVGGPTAGHAMAKALSRVFSKKTAPIE